MLEKQWMALEGSMSRYVEWAQNVQERSCCIFCLFLSTALWLSASDSLCCLGSCCWKGQGCWSQSWQGGDEEGPSGWQESPGSFAPWVRVLDALHWCILHFELSVKNMTVNSEIVWASIQRPKKPPADSEEAKKRSEKNKRKKEKKKRRRLKSTSYGVLKVSVILLSLCLSTNSFWFFHGRAELKSWVEPWECTFHSMHLGENSFTKHNQLFVGLSLGQLRRLLYKLA